LVARASIASAIEAYELDCVYLVGTLGAFQQLTSSRVAGEKTGKRTNPAGIQILEMLNECKTLNLIVTSTFDVASPRVRDGSRDLKNALEKQT